MNQLLDSTIRATVITLAKEISDTTASAARSVEAGKFDVAAAELKHANVNFLKLRALLGYARLDTEVREERRREPRFLDQS